MSKVIAKFHVDSVTKIPRHDDKGVLVGTAGQVRLTAVQDEMFGPYTPHGDVSMTIHNEAATKIFENNIGKAMMIEFIPIGEEE